MDAFFLPYEVTGTQTKATPYRTGGPEKFRNDRLPARNKIPENAAVRRVFGDLPILVDEPV